VIHRRRYVFHIAGYDPATPQEQHQRFTRQLEIFKQTWKVQSETSRIDIADSYPRWSVTTNGPNWRAETRFELLAWDDLIKKDASKCSIIRLLRAMATYLNLLLTGTLGRYLLANTRYFAFTIVPLLELILLAVVAWWVAFYLASQFGWPPIVECALGAVAGLGLFLLLLEWPGHWWRIYQALDDWNLSLDYVYATRKDLENRLDQFAERITACAREGKADEIIVIGHSLGATFAIDAVARALDVDPELGRRGGAVSVVTVGATIPKCVLHPAAQRIRDQVAKIVGEPSVHWVEYQARADAISFYRFNPVTLRRIKKAEQFEGKPIFRRLQITDMLKPETFKKYRLRALRLHYQFVSANDRRAPYDYFMMICGPLFVVKWTSSPLGLLDFFHDVDNATVVDTLEQCA
jgi:pimeloyl-ACP methyl ester carboxylesterase